MPSDSARAENPCYTKAAAPFITAAATRSQDGELSIYLLNRSNLEQSVQLRCDREMFTTEWRHDHLTHPRKVRADKSGDITITIAPMSLAALTTLRPDL